VGPDGQCALCRSASMPRPRQYPTRVLLGIVAATLLVSAGALAYRAVTSLAHPAIAREPSSDHGASPSSLHRPPQTPFDPAVTPLDSSEPSPAGIPIPLSEAVPLAADPPLVTREATLAASAAPERSVPPGRSPPTPAEVQAALSATPIVMYSASWCDVCRKAKQFLSANGLRYQEIDADAKPGAWDQIAQLTGRRGVPLIIVDGEQMPPGLNPSRVMLAVSHSMQRRLGVSDVQFARP